MSNLNKKRIRKVQKGGLSTITGGIGATKDKLEFGTNKLAGAYSELRGSTGAGSFTDKLGKITNLDDQTEEKLNSLKSSKFADETIWDLLYEEPCYVDPGSGHIVLTKIKQLWCTFQNEELKELLDISQKKTIKIANINQCRDEYFKNKYNKTPEQVKEDVTAHQEFWNKIEDIQGKKLGPEPKPDEGDTNYDKAIEKLKKHCPDSIEETRLTNNLDTTNLLFSPPTGANPEDTGGGEEQCQPIKWAFCFIFKFLLGPGGFFVIKMLPHIIKFMYAVKESWARIFTGLGNALRSTFMSRLLGEEQKPYVYYGKIKLKDADGNLTGKSSYGFVKDFKPGFLDTTMAYFGTVIPWNYVNYDMGQKYGKGEFGKLIVGLVIVSAVIIIIGGVGITMLFLCFAFYCMKTLSMFSDNLKEKGKSKA